MKTELEGRIAALRIALEAADPDFGTALIAGRINQYYLTGTMQDGLFVLQRDGGAYLFIRKSYERARQECPLDILYKYSSYREIQDVISPELGNTFIDADVVPITMLERLKKYFKMDKLSALDRIVLNLRTIKSPYELSVIRKSGEQHRRLLEEEVPALLREGMSEAEFQGKLFLAMMKLGYHGISRFSMFQAEIVAGQLGFGENSVYPTSFDGPGGMKGMSPAAPGVGSNIRTLKKGDLAFVDVGFGIDGYHSDKTQVYSFGAAPGNDIVKIHRACMDVEKRCSELLVAGAVPSEIYNNIMNSLPASLSLGFMGYGESVNFLGHGVGLHLNETPVIANGFDTPLSENTVIALEPKCGIPEIGTVGVEETYIVKNGYSECVTGGARDIITVY
jgi:Xaa-Pro dipeptidase